MNKNIFILFVCLGLTSSVFSQAVYRSSGLGTSWGDNMSWTLFSGVDSDGNGIPDANDDVTILSGHTINLSSNTTTKSLTVNGGGTFNGAGKFLGLKGNLTNSGTIGTGLKLSLSATSLTISSSSALVVSSFLAASSTVAIASGTQITCNTGSPTAFQLLGSSTINNSGTLIVGSLNNSTVSPPFPVFNNLSGGSLTMSINLPRDITLNSSNNSTIILRANLTSIPNNWDFYHLSLLGSSVKTCSATLNVSGNLSNGAGSTLNLASNTLNLLGNLTNSGTISNISTLNLIGTANQTLSSSSALTIPTLASTNTNTIILNTGTYNLSSAVTFAGSLTLNTATLDLNSNTLNLAGNLSNSGTLSNIVDVNFNGTVITQNISSTSPLTITNLACTNGNGVNITAGTYSVTNSLTVNNGQLDCGTELVTLVSDMTKTAYIAQSTGTIAGSMIIQRYIPAKTASYSDLSTPVSGTTIDDWDDELYMTINAPNNVPGYPGGDGMIASPNEFYSVTEYNTATNWYDSIVTGTTLNVGQGYSVWMADDDTQFPGRTIDSRGTPNMLDIPVSVVYDAGNPVYPGWNLIGNPHAAFIDWGDVVLASSNVNSNIQIYDGSGNYVDDLSEPEIAPGQGFWCEVIANTTVNFPQTCKRTTTSSSFMRTSNIKNYDLKLRLSSSSNPYFHEIKINYEDNASLGFEQGKDIPFIKSPKQLAPNITFKDGGFKFIRNKMNTNSPMVVLPLEINTPVAGNYSIELEGLLSNGVYSEAYLMNNATKEKVEIGDANSVTTYFEKDEINNNYSLILKKANVPFNLNGDNVSIFSTADFINVKGNFETAQTVKIEVYDIVGKLVLNTTSELQPNDRITLPTSNLQSEVYVVKVTTSNNKQFTNKIVVTK